MRALLLAAIVLLASLAPALASAYPDPGAVPRYYPSDCYEQHTKRFVHDFLEIVPEEYGVEMEGAACEIYKKTSAHFVLLTVPDTEGEVLENYAFHLFEEWGIGDKDRLDGIMLVYVADYLGTGESALRIEVGYGLEGVIDPIVTDDTWNIMVDARDRALEAGETGTSARMYAMAMGMAYLLAVLRENYTEGGFPPPDPAPGAYASEGGGSGIGQMLFSIFMLMLVLGIILYLSERSRGNSGWGYHGPSSPGWNTPTTRVWIPPSYGGNVGGGSFGGGGGSFGGGRSGGGGRGGKF